eukprot:CAMPEP_0206021132 /NCGR_PEP_ID=MMETSP1464-20131121/32325_1 /ASSEMBLY_ACC=CAM_ASM_001124 /TAXON_ID=119497 /ORGANISM="Exanthemachrysis gayraliae, Strain RCC1523" /LENGTH=381 /DNA_ID=CAMNT_0053395077 /DNA_START=1 /DNA_END=1142 /DNA_ORIENTATION=-
MDVSPRATPPPSPRPLSRAITADRPATASAAIGGPSRTLQAPRRSRAAPPFNNTIRHSVQLEQELKGKAAVFNNASSGKKGIQALIDRGMLADEPEAIGAFLKAAGPRLKQSEVADYLGMVSSRRVLEWMMDSLELTGMRIDSAVRKLNTRIQLRAEAQKIDRIVQCFASRYHACNPGVFEAEDQAYIFAFSLLMLNTDAHNDNVKHKMSKESFLSINREQKLPRAVLEDVYDAIVNCDLQIEERAQIDVVKEGWLLKQNRRRVGWRRRYVVVSTRAIYVYKSEADALPSQFCPLEFSVIAQQTSVGPMARKFEVRCVPDGATPGSTPRARSKSGPSGGPETSLRPLVFEAKDEKTAKDWIKAIQQFTLQEGVLVVPEEEL